MYKQMKMGLMVVETSACSFLWVLGGKLVCACVLVLAELVRTYITDSDWTIFNIRSVTL